jgi:16S rRNA C967 or C1407 C5-methylase (RsmB/RsmF family)/NOL1/NOP2/fmu family ribosome biogenesis protein
MSELPIAFTERIRSQFAEVAESFLQALDRPARSSVRYNSGKPTAVFTEVDAVPWNEQGYWLNQRPVFTLDPLFHAGCYYPQESSSMFLQWVLKQVVPVQKGMKALDLCAAPGGKTLILSDHLKSDGVVVANEVIASRARILREVVTKWGCRNTIVTNGTAQSLGELAGWFDVMLVDAPCSGEGMFRKDPAAREEWTAQSVERCSLRQHEILTEVLPALREGGILIYSTCTFAPEENERMLGSLIDSGEYESIRFEVPEDWPVDQIVSGELYACRFLPHRTDGEGFFIGALRKKAPSGSTRAKAKAIFKALDAATWGYLEPWCAQLNHPVLGPDSELYDAPLDLNQLNTLAGEVYVLQPGVHLGRTVRTDFIPDHGLAMSGNVNDAVSRVELDGNQAINYLRGDAIHLAEGGFSGWCLATHQGHALGWIKVIGTRINNYYPKEWRVRMR